MRLAIVSLAVILLSGCTSGSDPETSPTPEPTGATATSSPSAGSPSTAPAPTGPDCAAIWQPGKKLPRDYDSCIDDGQPAEQEVVKCQDGSSLVIYRDEFYAVTGDPIVHPDVAPLQDTDEFTTSYTACTGE